MSNLDVDVNMPVDEAPVVEELNRCRRTRTCCRRTRTCCRRIIRRILL